MTIVFPKYWCGGTLLVTVFYKAFYKEIVGKDSQSWEAVNTMENFEVDPTITHVFEKVILVN